MGEREREEVVIIDGKDCFQTRTRKKRFKKKTRRKRTKKTIIGVAAMLPFTAGVSKKENVFVRKKTPTASLLSLRELYDTFELLKVFFKSKIHYESDWQVRRKKLIMAPASSHSTHFISFLQTFSILRS